VVHGKISGFLSIADPEHTNIRIARIHTQVSVV
jgi:hypothetical protein